MSDPLGCLNVPPDEQVLWHGQPGVTLSAPDRLQVRSFGLAAFLIVVVTMSQVGWTTRLPFALVVAALTASGVALSKLVGGCQVSIGYLLTAGPLFAVLWALTVSQRGLSATLTLLVNPCSGLIVVLLLAAALRVMTELLRQLHTHYYVTSRRIAQVEARGDNGRVRWVTPLPTGWLQLRVIRPWGSRGRGHIAIGTGARRKLLRWLQHPEATLEDIKRSVGGFQEGPPGSTRAAPAVDLDRPPAPEAG